MPYDVGCLNLCLVSVFLFALLDGERLRVVLLPSHHCWSTQIASNGEIVVAIFGISASGTHVHGFGLPWVNGVVHDDKCRGVSVCIFVDGCGCPITMSAWWLGMALRKLI